MNIASVIHIMTDAFALLDCRTTNRGSFEEDERHLGNWLQSRAANEADELTK